MVWASIPYVGSYLGSFATGIVYTPKHHRQTSDPVHASHLRTLLENSCLHSKPGFRFRVSAP